MSRKTSPFDRENFAKRLQRSRAALERRDRESVRRGSAYGFGFRLASDLIVGVLAGFAIGWGLDKWLGTSPWFLLAFTPLGVAAGIVNVMRLARSREAERYLEQTRTDAPAVEDDDDDL